MTSEDEDEEPATEPDAASVAPVDDEKMTSRKFIITIYSTIS